jgi:hypothetical protein
VKPGLDNLFYHAFHLSFDLIQDGCFVEIKVMSCFKPMFRYSVLL